MGSLAGLDPRARPWAEAFVSGVQKTGLGVIVTSVRRSRAKQAALYREYVAGRTPYPVAPPGKSWHEYGLAWDMVIEPREYQALVGGWWRSWGGVWDPSDEVHFGFP